MKYALTTVTSWNHFKSFACLRAFFLFCLASPGRHVSSMRIKKQILAYPCAACAQYRCQMNICLVRWFNVILM